MAYSLVCDSVLKLLIQVKYDIKPKNYPPSLRDSPPSDFVEGGGRGMGLSHFATAPFVSKTR
jgi:hypothetical protein